jgi:hypothetical protein
VNVVLSAFLQPVGALTIGSQYGNAGTDLEPFSNATGFVREAEKTRVKISSPTRPTAAISM